MTLIEIVRPLCPNLFAVVDGALAKGFHDRCGAAGLSARSLYNGEFASVGPQLVALPDEPSLDRFGAILQDSLRPVFWAWVEGEAALYRHLRRLGKVEVPDHPEDGRGSGFQTVIFRHGDPASLIQVLPVLDGAQRDAFFASSPGLVFEHRDRRGRREIVRARRDGRLMREPSASVTSARALPISF